MNSKNKEISAIDEWRASMENGVNLDKSSTDYDMKIDNLPGLHCDPADITSGNEFITLGKCFDNLLHFKNDKDVLNDALTMIRRVLNRCFGIDCTIAIIDTAPDFGFYGFNMYPSVDSINKIVTDLISNIDVNSIRDVWRQCNMWHIDIDGKMLYDLSAKFTPNEITTLLLYNIEEMIFDYETPVKISYAIYNALSMFDYRVSSVSKSDACKALYSIPFIYACSFVNYRTNIDNASLLMRDNHTMERYRSAIKKIMSRFGTYGIIDRDKLDLERGVVSIMNWIFESVNDLKYSSGRLRKNLIAQIHACRSPFVREVLQDIFFKFSKITNKLPSMEQWGLPETPEMKDMNEKIVDEHWKQMYHYALENALNNEFLDKNGYAKKVTQQEIDMLRIECSNIESTDDKLYMLERMYRLQNIVDNSLDMLSDPKMSKRVKQSRNELEKLRDHLQEVRLTIIKTNIAPQRFGLFVKYPQGYEG